MNKLLLLILFCLSAFVLAGCYYNTLDTEAFIPERCIFASADGVDCKDFSLKEDGTLKITLKFTKDLEAAKLKVESECSPTNIDVRSGEQIIFTCNVASGEQGQFYKQDIELTSGKDIKHSSKGTFACKYS